MGYRHSSSELEAETALGHYELHGLLDHQIEEFTVLSRVTDPNYQGELGCYYTME